MSERTNCRQPDRHVSGLKCGHPLPCPHHTITLDKDVMRVPGTAHIEVGEQMLLGEVRRTLFKVSP